MKDLSDIDPIVRKYLNEEALSPEEDTALHRWINEGEGRTEMLEDLKNNTGRTRNDLTKMENIPNIRPWDKFKTRLQSEGIWLDQQAAPALEIPPFRRRLLITRLWWAAASVIIAIVGSVLFFTHQRTPNLTPPVVAEDPHPVDIAPGGNRAVLTLADGRRINLDSSANGQLAQQGNTRISKTADGQLAYHKSSAEEKPTSPAYNILSTPRAGQFTLTLPDGSRVWLNNASALRYPVAFTGATREVELTGEAYFDVTKDAAHPFLVKIYRGGFGNEGGAGPASTVEVLGTSFNIMAYPDETIQQATLIEGSIRYSGDGKSALLKPAEQSSLDAQGNLTTKKKVDVAEVTAWKEGYFHFDHASLETTMRQLARWYDISVEYRGTVPPQEFMGKIERNIPLSAILRALEGEHVHFKLEGKKLVVTP